MYRIRTAIDLTEHKNRKRRNSTLRSLAIKKAFREKILDPLRIAGFRDRWVKDLPFAHFRSDSFTGKDWEKPQCAKQKVRMRPLNENGAKEMKQEEEIECWDAVSIAQALSFIFLAFNLNWDTWVVDRNVLFYIRRRPKTRTDGAIDANGCRING